MQLLAGGLLLTLASAATGEWSRFSIDAIAATPRATLALAYLVLFGTLLGYTCYIWLLGAAPPSVSSSYAYINPLVAVILGASLGREPLTGRTLLAAGIIIAGVVILVTAGQASRRRRPPAQPEVAISDASAAGAKV
jgi:drug/metabolite transporter (DMT)-like permease